jgi:hypothetical protein
MRKIVVLHVSMNSDPTFKAYVQYVYFCHLNSPNMWLHVFFYHFIAVYYGLIK